ncbi:MAG: DUF748 domain-containing protein [Proteobacteria bacterium]|nr:MAG: DUF748 domain-containing protein [Pseudomonadota bacterium]
MRNKLFFKLSIVFSALVILLVIAVYSLPAGIRWGGEKWLRDQGMEAEIDDVELDLSEGWVVVRGAKGKAPDGGGFDLRSFRVTWRWSPMWDKQVRIAGIEVDGLDIDATRNAQGQMKVGGLIIPSADTMPQPPPTTPPAAPSPWHYGVGGINVTDLRVCYQDEILALHTEEAVRGFADVCARWAELAWHGETSVGPQPADATLPLPWRVTGSLRWTGLAVTSAAGGELRFGFKEFLVQQLKLQGGETMTAEQVVIEELRLADPVHEQHLADWVTLERLTLDRAQMASLENLQLASLQLQSLALLQTQGSQTGQQMLGIDRLNLTALQIEQLTGAPNLSVQSVALEGVSALRRKPQQEGTPAHIATVKSLAVEALTMPEPSSLRIERLHLQTPAIWLGRGSQGSWEVIDWLALQEKADGAREAPPSESLKLLLGELRIDGEGKITLADHKVEPRYQETISDIRLSMDNIDTTTPGSSSPVTLEAAIGRYGKLALAGEVKPFAVRPDLTLTGTVSGIDLGPVTSYARDVVQHHIRQGSLDVELNVKVDNGMLDSEVKVELHKLELEPLSEEEKAGAAAQELGIPLNAALSLLRDKDDAIRLSLPIAGDVESPDVSVNNILGKVMGKAIKSAILAYYSPFGLLKLAGAVLDLATGLDFEPVAFAPGDAALPGEAQKSLGDIGKLLQERPQVRLALCGDVTRADFDQLYPPPPPPPPAPPAAKPDTAAQATPMEGGGPVQSAPAPAPAASVEPRTPTAEQAKTLWALAAKRAEAVKDNLVDRGGIEAKRLIICNPEQTLKEMPPALVRISI